MRAGLAMTGRAKRLRRNMTEAERALWNGLRHEQLGWRFRRQHPIPPYVVDFACVELRLVVEADGGQHGSSDVDHVRNELLQSRGWRAPRFWNNDILQNRSGVLQVISGTLVSLSTGESPHPNPPPRAGEGIREDQEQS